MRVLGAPSDVLVEGKINDVPCVLLARHGRKHSIMPSNINYRANIWALRNVGCTHIIVSTATGSLQEDIKPGDIVILDNFIDFTKKRNQTFYDGKELSPFGVCHLPMEPAFCEKTRDVIIQTACDLGKWNLKDLKRVFRTIFLVFDLENYSMEKYIVWKFLIRLIMLLFFFGHRNPSP